jgi:hypothetical protein
MIPTLGLTDEELAGLGDQQTPRWTILCSLLNVASSSSYCHFTLLLPISTSLRQVSSALVRHGPDNVHYAIYFAFTYKPMHGQQGAPRCFFVSRIHTNDHDRTH